jgi:hypothetical protein
MGSTQISLQGWIFEKIFVPLASPINASLAYAIVFYSDLAGIDVDSLCAQDFISRSR